MTSEQDAVGGGDVKSDATGTATCARPTYVEFQDRPIKAIYWPGLEGREQSVGKFGIERITVEYVEQDAIDEPWFAVWVAGRVVSRWNWRHLEGVAYDT